MIFCFCLWRLYLEFKLTAINRILINRTLGLKDKNILKELDTKEKSRVGRKSFVPKSRNSVKDNDQFTIRMEE